jgi:acyl-CoA reductase-like NAD-dependent aldehyde dehydrogenase
MSAQPSTVQLTSGSTAPVSAENLIDGRWVGAADGSQFETFNPSTGSAIGTVANSGATDIDRAVKAARRSFESGDWYRQPPAQRARTLWRVADIIDQHAEQIAHLEVRNNGMTLKNARRLVATGSETFRYFAGWCTKIGGETRQISALGNYHSYTVREPIGVAGLIVPWNVPFIMACNKVASALTAGCSVVLKPAEETPLTAKLLGQCLMEADIPAGVVNIVNGSGERAGAALAAHPDVDKIGFTGSTSVGRLIVAAAAGNLKKVTLELGGKSPVLVFPDADLDAAAAGIALGIFSNSGQACIAGSRVFVHRDVLTALTSKLAAILTKLKVGDGFEQDTDLGPLISGRQLDRVCNLVESGVREGAELIVGGSRLNRQGYFFPPTLLTAPRPGAQILREEIFGPVANILPFSEVDEVVAAANDTEYGLAAAIWTRDIGNAHRTAQRIKAGTVWLNCQMIADRSMPFGGYKQSGWGRENGLEGLEAYLQTKTVFASL